jgi:hypothetical protein
MDKLEQLMQEMRGDSGLEEAKGEKFNDPTIANLADQLRVAIAKRRDRLVRLQKRPGASFTRRGLIDQLGDDYRVVYAIALRAGL